MKKSTMAVVALLTALSSIPMVSVAYASDTPPPATTATCAGGKAADCSPDCTDLTDQAAKDACCKAASCSGNQ